MAATNFTPIILYHTTTASAAPTAGNLNNGELAINITDGKLFYKDNAGTVQVIATKGTGTIGGSTTQVQYNNAGSLAGSANFTFNGTTATINTLNLTNALGTTFGGTGLNAYTTGDLVYASGTNTLAKLGIGLNTYILTSTGSVPQWSAPSAVTVATATNLAGGAAGSVPYQSGASTTTFLSIGSAGQVLTSSGSAPQWSNLSSLGVTSLSFGTTGLTPSTATQGAITVAGTLATTNGGTGLTSFSANQVFYASSTSAVAQSSNLLYSGTDLTVYGITVGRGAGAVSTNTAVGASAMVATATGDNNSAFGANALNAVTSGGLNTAIGSASMFLNTSGANNTGVGVLTFRFNTTGSFNTAVGTSALYSNTTASNNTAVGYQAGYSNTTGGVTAIGYRAAFTNTTGTSNSAVGDFSLYSNTIGAANSAIGSGALLANTTGNYNTAVGYQAGYSNQSGEYNTYLGWGAGRSHVNTTTAGSVMIGAAAGYNTTTGGSNTFIGVDSGSAITTGSKNSILGRYNGNQGGLDIRTANNYIVLSDGDGNPRVWHDGTWLVSPNSIAQGNTQNINYGSGISFGAAGKGLLLQQTVNTNDERVYLTNNAQTSTASGFTGSFAYNKTGANATAYYQVAGQHLWLSADAGTAGNTISWTNILSAKKDTTLALQGASLESGTGITFPATQSASSNANTLDDYEEGNWTPSYTGTSGDPTVSYIVRTAKYVKIGKQVTAWCYVYISSTAGGGGNIYLSGLPFTCTGVQGGAFNNWTNNGWTTQAPQGGHVPTGQTYVMLTYYIATGTAQVPVANLANACELTLCVTYQTD